jgi:hypothetical protein
MRHPFRVLIAASLAVLLLTACEVVFLSPDEEAVLTCDPAETAEGLPLGDESSGMLRCTDVYGEVTQAKAVVCRDNGSAGVLEVDHTPRGRCKPRPTTTTTEPPTTTTVPPTTTTAPAGTLYWHGNADTDVDYGTDKTACMDKELQGTSPSLTIVDDPAGLHGKVYRASVTGDGRAEWNESYANCSGANPVDLWGPTSPPGDEVYIGWRSYYAGSYGLTGSSNDGNVLQWKGRQCAGPAVGGTLNDYRMSLRTLDGDPPGGEGYWMDPVSFGNRMGEWHDYVMRVNFSTTSAGFIELWVDGEPQVFSDGTTRHEGPTVGGCGETRIYPKWGVYSFPSNSAPVHYLEDPKIGSTYAVVAP